MKLYTVMPLLADISSIPADFVKYFIMMVVALGGMWLAHRKGSQASGTKAEPVNIAQPLEVKRSPEWAGKDETEKGLQGLDDQIEAMARENLRQHNATALRINEVIQAGHAQAAAGESRVATLLEALHHMETRMTAATLHQVKSIHERINPLEGHTAAHAEALKHHSGRMAELWQRLCDLWDHITKLKK